MDRKNGAAMTGSKSKLSSTQGGRLKSAARIAAFFLLFTALCVVALLPQLRSLAAPVNPGTTGLVSWWALDETSGNRADAHGSNTLTDNNTVGYVAGKKSNAAYFILANSEYLSVADTSSLEPGSGSFTLCSWIVLNTKTAQQAIGDKWTTTSNQREYMLDYDVANDSFRIQVSADGTGATVLNSTLTPITTSTWYFVCSELDNTNDLMKISVNAGTANTVAFTTNAFAGTSAFYLGRHAGGTSHYLDAALDEVVYYSRALSADEISWLYNSGTGRTYSEVSATATPTSTSTATAVPPTATNTATYTAVPPTATNTATAIPPTATDTATNTTIPPTATNTATKTSTPANTATHTPTDTATDTATITSTATDTATITLTPTVTYTPSMTLTPSVTPTINLTSIALGTPYYSSRITYGDIARINVLACIAGMLVLFGVIYLVVTFLQRRPKG